MTKIQTQRNPNLNTQSVYSAHAQFTCCSVLQEGKQTEKGERRRERKGCKKDRDFTEKESERGRERRRERAKD